MEEYNLAQMNIAQARGSMESEIMEEFVNRLDEINSLAELSIPKIIDGIPHHFHQDT